MAIELVKLNLSGNDINDLPCEIAALECVPCSAGLFDVMTARPSLAMVPI